jgi:predicted dehydrogenase
MSGSRNSRRQFLRTAAKGAALLSVGGILPGFSASSYANILGANERINLAVMGVNSRGFALATNFAAQKNARIRIICDVDKRAAGKCQTAVQKVQGQLPLTEKDIRKTLASKDIDALVVAAPDHWHAPAAILAAKAGKHVYLEKPASHNPQEGELLLAVQKKYNTVVQMGNQRRSWPNIVEGIKSLQDGLIGRPYMAKTWYSNNRPTIGIGKTAPVPEWLDFDLWQGPAPRAAFKDNLIHYNWHWFWHWGTGEALNNGTHMVDIARWGLQETYPTRVLSSGGRYRYQDDWETPDTQNISIEFGNRSTITWEGRSCNSRHVEGSSVGVIFYAENGTMEFDGGNSYSVYDLKNKLVREVKNDSNVNAASLSNPSEMLDAIHLNNFLDAIRTGASLNAEIVGGHQSTLLVQLGNIAQRTGSILEIDAANGHIKNNATAQELWKRSYEPGWEPTL